MLYWAPMVKAAGGARLFTIKSRYRILEMLGEGGAGAVYRAFDSVEGREVALKVLHAPACEESPDRALSAASALEEEFRVLASQSHPHLAEVHDYGTTPEGLRYFTMELIRGEDLKRFLGRRVKNRERPAEDP